MKYYLGLDNGGTATKAAVFDENGKEVAVAGMDTVMLVPKPGFTERDMEEMWEANCQVIRRALEKAGVTGDDIACEEMERGRYGGEGIRPLLPAYPEQSAGIFTSMA